MATGRVTIAVQDAGIGIPECDRERVFEPFVRGSGEEVTGTAGSGLGLAFVARVVSAHGGTVQLDSQLRHGTTFTIVLPLDSRPAVLIEDERQMSSQAV
jgi:signal transduction histidine kinase